MKNKLTDLNNHLFAQLERLSDDDLQGDKLLQEIQRANAINGIAANIVGAAKVTVDAWKIVGAGKINSTELPEIFAGSPKQIANQNVS